MTITMFDTVDISTVPANPQAVAGYVGGNWPTYSPLVRKFPRAKHLSIAVNASEDAECLDVEAGDAVPSDCPAWFKRQKARGVKRPCFYGDLSNQPLIQSALSGAGIQRSEYRVWSAHYTNQAHIEPGSDATQWTSNALGRNLDESLCQNEFFSVPVPVYNPPHYDWFYTGPFPSPWGPLNERTLVENYDKFRKHPVLNVLRLAHLKTKIGYLANRVSDVAHKQPVNGKPSWGQYHRGWRFQQLIHRAQGVRFV